MKIANAIQGGLAGATTLTLLEKALENIDTGKPKMKLLNKPGIIKKLKKKSKNGNNEIYIEVAKELLAAGAYYGFIKLGKKKNALLRGGLLGAATGLGVAFLDTKDKDKAATKRAHAGLNEPAVGDYKKDLATFWQENKEKLLTVGLYTAGGVLAGAALKKMNKKRKKK